MSCPRHELANQLAARTKQTICRNEPVTACQNDAAAPGLTPLAGYLGGRTRTRTWDPLIKSQLLYQLSYAPRATTAGTPASWRRLAKGRHAVQQTSRRALVPAAPSCNRPAMRAG